MKLYSKIHAAFFLINILLVIVIIFRERRNVAVTWSWLVVLVFIPIFGFFLYILFGQNVRKGKLYKNNQEANQWIPELVQADSADQTRTIR